MGEEAKEDQEEAIHTFPEERENHKSMAELEEDDERKGLESVPNPSMRVTISLRKAPEVVAKVASKAEVKEVEEKARAKRGIVMRRVKY